MDNKIHLIIAGHPIILSFTMRDWERLEDEICTIEELDSVLKQKGRIKIIYKILAILAHDDLVTEDWLKLNFRPNLLTKAVNAINTTILTILLFATAVTTWPSSPHVAPLDKEAPVTKLFCAVFTLSRVAPSL